MEIDDQLDEGKLGQMSYTWGRKSMSWCRGLLFIKVGFWFLLNTTTCTSSSQLIFRFASLDSAWVSTDNFRLYRRLMTLNLKNLFSLNFFSH